MKNPSLSVYPADAWGEYARHYDALLSLQPYRNLLRDAARSLAEGRPETILDAACGTGNLELVSREFPELTSAHFSCVDREARMLEIARKKLLEERIPASFHHHSLDLRLPFLKNSFDAVVSINTLYAVTDPEFVLQEFFRVLKGGCSLVLSTPKEGNDNGLILKEHCQSKEPDAYWTGFSSNPERAKKLIREAISDPELQDAALFVAEQNRKIDMDSSFHFFREEVLSNLLERVGFSIVKRTVSYAAQNLFLIAMKPFTH